MSHEAIRKEFLRGTKIGATPVAHGIALPHFVSPDISHPHLVLVRACDGAIIPVQKSEIPDERPTTKPKSASGDAGAPESALPTNGHDDDAADSAVVAYGLFFLVSPSEDPGQHLRMLAKIASRVDQAGFMTKWVRARSVWELREILIHDEHALSITVKQDARTSELAGRTLKDVDWPYGSLVALIERDDDSIIPRGSTIIQVGDLVTVIGDAEAIEKLRRRYSETPNKAD